MLVEQQSLVAPVFVDAGVACTLSTRGFCRPVLTTNMSLIKLEPADDPLQTSNECSQHFTYDVKVEIESDSLLKAGINLYCLAEHWNSRAEPSLTGTEALQELSHGTECVTAPNVNSYPMFDELMKICVASCTFCPKRFMNRYFLLKHNLKHAEIKLSPPTLYQCHFCNNNFTQKLLLVKHLAKKHPRVLMSTKPITKSLIKCKFCSKTYKYKTWHEHIRTVHNNGQKTIWKCNVCHKLFKCEKNLSRHYRYLHCNEKPKWMKKREREKNKNDDNWQCPYCTKSFKNRDCVDHHVNNVHSGGKPFKCYICSSLLKSEPYLKTHMRRVHYDDGNLHDCDICGKIFKSPRYLSIHKKNSHKIKRSIMNKIVYNDEVL